MRFILGMMLLTVLVGLISNCSRADVEHTTDSLDTIKARLEAKKAVLVDVRERKEWDQGHLKDALFLPLSDLQVWQRDGVPEDEKAKLAKTIPAGSIVYCHCAAGGRSLPGAEALKKLGYDARPLKPGYKDLVGAGFTRAEQP